MRLYASVRFSTVHGQCYTLYNTYSNTIDKGQRKFKLVKFFIIFSLLTIDKLVLFSILFMSQSPFPFNASGGKSIRRLIISFFIYGFGITKLGSEKSM